MAMQIPSTAQWDLFSHLCMASKKQSSRLLDLEATSSDKSYKEKAQYIDDAISRLYTMIMNYDRNAPASIKALKLSCHMLDEPQYKHLDISTMDLMLDAEISEWKVNGNTAEEIIEKGLPSGGYLPQISLRKALNISRNNIFNILGGPPGQLGTRGPIWGKSRSLCLLEEELKY